MRELFSIYCSSAWCLDLRFYGCSASCGFAGMSVGLERGFIGLGLIRDPLFCLILWERLGLIRVLLFH